ncbi:MAG: hypothetical protein IPH54_16700 [Rhodoferax sp.]|nr:hypothetical protein [Rhodoferax sp.]
MDFWLDSSKPGGLKTTRSGQPAPNNGDLAMRAWEQRESARTGKPVPQVLAELLEQSGGKWETIGLLSNMTHQAAHRMFVRNGIQKKPVHSFEFRGVTASMVQHCKTHGLSYFAVKQYVRSHEVSRADALELYVTNQVKKHHWGVPQ